MNDVVKLGIVKKWLNSKVDKVTGKGLSTNDYTTEDKNKLAGIEDQANRTILSTNVATDEASDVKASTPKSVKTYVDAVVGALPNGLVYRGAVNYYSDLPGSAAVGDTYTVLYQGSSGTVEDGTEYAYGPISGVNQWIGLGPDISNKVDKVAGKGLSTSDYTTEEKNKLSGVESQANKTVLSTDVSGDGTSDAKAATPKAVKTYVDDSIKALWPFTGSWDAVEGILNAGEGPNVFSVGDEFYDDWTDQGNSAVYNYPWRINHFSTETLEDESTITGAFFQARWAHPFGVQFSHQRVFYKCPDGLAAGTYYFTIESSWGTHVVAGDVVCFTLANAVPAGGRLAGCYAAPDTAKSDWRIYVYSADGKTVLETVTPTFAASGTDLGTLKATMRNGNFNCVQEMAYGSNRWKTSAIRQYLNSGAAAGAWWTAQDDWDIAPDQLSSKPGFLTGVPADLLAVLKPIRTTTYCNTVNDGGGADITYDRVFLPSLEQMYIATQVSGEGAYHEWWKQVGERETPYPWYTATPALVHYAVENHNSPQIVRLRSAYRGRAYGAWYVNSAGSVDYYYYASNAYRFSPLVFI